jgi:hypothetical protein
MPDSAGSTTSPARPATILPIAGAFVGGVGGVAAR